MEQRSEEWFSARLMKVTASRVGDIMSKTKSGYSASRKNYMMQLLCERLTGEKEESFTSAAMQHGIDTEDLARIAYEAETETIVKESGFITHPDIEDFGASPDGEIDNGLIEIKCPNTAKHVDFLQTGKIDTKYLWQMRAQMACANKDWCDFVSYDDRLPQSLALKIKRVERDFDLEREMIEEIKIFLAELSEIELNLKKEVA